MIAAAETLAIPGAVLTCPECHAKIGTLTKPLFQNFSFGLDCIRFEPDQKPEAGTAHCRKCGASYAEIDISKRARAMLIHTEYGWLPKPPPNVPAPKRRPIRRVLPNR